MKALTIELYKQYCNIRLNLFSLTKTPHFAICFTVVMSHAMHDACVCRSANIQKRNGKIKHTEATKPKIKTLN